jgi:hypothetical protein
VVAENREPTRATLRAAQDEWAPPQATGRSATGLRDSRSEPRPRAVTPPRNCESGSAQRCSGINRYTASRLISDAAVTSSHIAGGRAPADERMPVAIGLINADLWLDSDHYSALITVLESTESTRIEYVRVRARRHGQKREPATGYAEATGCGCGQVPVSGLMSMVSRSKTRVEPRSRTVNEPGTPGMETRSASAGGPVGVLPSSVSGTCEMALTLVPGRRYSLIG